MLFGQYISHLREMGQALQLGYNLGSEFSLAGQGLNPGCCREAVLDAFPWAIP